MSKSYAEFDSQYFWKYPSGKSLRAALILSFLALPLPGISDASELSLRILETSDLHSHILDFDYYTDQPTPTFGLARTASLIKAARAEVKNALLVDNGDLIQGSALAEYWAEKGIAKGEIHSVYKAMNSLNYTLGNLGNHDFNYGLEFLFSALKGAKFPYINANIFDAKTGKHLFTPYLIKPLVLTDRDGKPHSVKVGFIGFVPPQIMVWDKINLAGKVQVADIKATAEALVPEMKAKGADVIIAIPHSGISTRPYVAMAENSVYYLSQVKGIDAIVFGHSHGVFPSADFAQIDGADIKHGTLNGVPAVMPGFWGNHLGVVDLQLSDKDGHWKVVSGKAEARPIYDPATKKSLVASDAHIHQLLAEDQAATRKFVAQPIGKSATDIFNYLVQIQDDASIQIINDAQTDYVKRYVQGDPDLSALPILSAAAPFKAGGRRNDPSGYLELPKGDWSLRNAVDIYPYPNTLVVLKLSGAQIREWLECAAGIFNRIDPHSKKSQPLINWTGFSGFNFDVIDGIEYQIDVTQAPRYDGNCALINPDSSRIAAITYKGKPLDVKQNFLLATNNYRAFGNKFPGTGGDNLAFAAPDDNRTVLTNYIEQQTKNLGKVTVTTDNNWRIKSISKGSPTVILETASGKPAQEYILKNSQYPMKYIDNDEQGFARYQIDLTKPR